MNSHLNFIFFVLLSTLLANCPHMSPPPTPRDMYSLVFGVRLHSFMTGLMVSR